MGQIVEILWDDDGTKVWAEVSEDVVEAVPTQKSQAPVKVAAGRTLRGGRQKEPELPAETEKSVTSVLKSMTPKVKTVLDTFRAANPDEVTVEFGLKLGKKVGVVLAEGSGEVNFKVALKWIKNQPPKDQTA